MKCKYCNGTGTSNTCVNGTFKPCTFCDGTGEYEHFDADVELDKLDSEPLTNEEWFGSLTTNEKAYHLADICAWAMEEFRCGKTEKANTGYWQKWLKEKHE